MALRELREEEKEALWIALSMRSGFIETGSINHRATDVERMGKAAPFNLEAKTIKIKALSTDQKLLTILNDELVSKILNGQVYIDD